MRGFHAPRAKTLLGASSDAILTLNAPLSLTPQTEKGDDELKDKKESEIFNATGTSKNWLYVAAFIFVVSIFYQQLMSRSGVAPRK